MSKVVTVAVDLIVDREIGAGITDENISSSSTTISYMTVTSSAVLTGPSGADGQGVPTGGNPNQVLAKVSSTDFDTQWVDQSGGSQSYTEYVFNPNGVQEDNRFNNFADLHAALQELEGARRVWFEESETVLDDTGMPPEGWNLDNVTFACTQPAALGGMKVRFTGGFKTTGWANGGAMLVGLIADTNQPVISHDSGIHLFQTNGTAIVATTGSEPFIEYKDTVVGVISMSGGSGVGDVDGSGTYPGIPVDASSAVTVFSMKETGTALAGNAIKGTGFVQVVISDTSVSPTVLTMSFPSHTGFVNRQVEPNSLLLNYDNNSSGLSATNVQDAIDELKAMIDNL